MGGYKRERPSEAKRAANRENAKKPRVKMPEDLRAAILQGKSILAEALAGPGCARVAELIRDPATPPELFQWAMNFAGDRAGLPRQNEHSINASSLTPVAVVVRRGEGGGVAEGLGWPVGVERTDAVGGGGGGDDRAGDGVVSH